jgi:predicted acetyltransferase
MQATERDFEAMIDLAEECFPRDRELGGMLPRWGHCFRREKMDNSLIIKDDGKIVAHVACIDQEVIIEGGTIRVGGVSSVATKPGYRGRGLMTELLNRASSFMRSQGYPLSDLGGDRLRYGRFGWETAGIKWEFGITKRSASARSVPEDIDVGAWEGTERERRATLRLHNGQGFGLRRDAELHRILLERHGKTVSIARRGSRIDSYCVVAGDKLPFHEEERRICRIDELAGTASGIHALIADLLFREGYERVSVPMPWSHPLNGRIRELSSGWSTGPWRMLKILDLPEIFHRFQAQISRRAREASLDLNRSISIGIEGEESAVVIEVDGDRISFSESKGPVTIQLTESEAVLLLFGQTPPDLLAKLPSESRFIRALLPLEFFLWLNETV